MKKRILAVLMAAAMVLGVAGCSSETQEETPEEQTPESETQARFTPGDYTASADGYGGSVSVQVTVDEQNIVSVTVLENSETVGIGQVALDQLAQEIVDKQSLALDVVVGATYSSNAILTAVEEALSQAADDLSFLKVEKESESQGELQVLETDVVIAGAGLSGLSAAVSASEAGADVILLEKLGFTGGSAKTSLGAFMICEVEENEGYHVTDEPDTMEAALKRWSDYQSESLRESQYPDMERVEYMLTQTMYTIDWLTQQGAAFTPRNKIAERGMALLQVDVPDLSEESGTPAGRLLEKLRQVAVENGVTLYLETPATELIVEDGKVVGLRAQSPEGELEIRANSVILATGGYSESPELLERFIPDAGEIYTFGNPGNTGDGILMAEAVGAALYEDPWIHPGWPAPTNEFKAASPYATVFMEYSSPIEGVSESSYDHLMIDKDGNRFMNEAANYSTQVIKMVDLANGPYWSFQDNLSEQVAAIADAGLSTGTVIKGDTIEELAQQAGMDAATLQATVDRYNELAAAGEDTDFGKDPARLAPISSEGPYYLVEMIPSACDTLGGVKTNYDQQVLREDGSVIEGLYAVGSMSNRQYYNQMYFSGSALSFAATAGKNAGALAAAN